MLVPPIGGLVAAFQHGPRQVWAVQALRQLYAGAGLSQKAAAAVQGLTEPQWSRQCQNVEGSHVSLQRTMQSPDAVLAGFGEVLIDKFAPESVVTVKCDELRRLIEINQRIADALDARPQLRMDLATAIGGQQEKRRA